MGASICQVLGMTPSSVLKRRGAGLRWSLQAPAGSLTPLAEHLSADNRPET